jgi:predicted transcriptional regulator
MVLQLTRKVIDFILKIDKEGSITKKGSELNTLSYYSLVWFLRDMDLIDATKINDTNEKKWELNEKGKQVAEHLKAIKDLTDEKN